MGRAPLCPLRKRDGRIVVCVRVRIRCASGYASSDNPFSAELGEVCWLRLGSASGYASGMDLCTRQVITLSVELGEGVLANAQMFISQRRADDPQTESLQTWNR